MTHLQLRNGVYHYRRRTPTALKPLIQTNMILRSLHRNYDIALQLASKLDAEIDSMKYLAMKNIVTPTAKPQVPKIANEVVNGGVKIGSMKAA